MLSLPDVVSALFEALAPEDGGGRVADYGLVGIEYYAPGVSEWFEPGSPDIPEPLRFALCPTFGEAVAVHIARVVERRSSGVLLEFAGVSSAEALTAGQVALSFEGGRATAWFGAVVPPDAYFARNHLIGGASIETIGDALADQWPPAPPVTAPAEAH